MRTLGLMLIIALLAACSAHGENKQVPTVEGVPVVGGGMAARHGR